MLTNCGGKRSICFAATRSFLIIAKGSQGHVLGQNGPRRPPWNTPKKCFLLRKRPKEDERVAQGYFHKRVNENPRSRGDFELLGAIVSFFVKKLRPFEQKVPV